MNFFVSGLTTKFSVDSSALMAKVISCVFVNKYKLERQVGNLCFDELECTRYAYNNFFLQLNCKKIINKSPQFRQSIFKMTITLDKNSFHIKLIWKKEWEKTPGPEQQWYIENFSRDCGIFRNFGFHSIDFTLRNHRTFLFRFPYIILKLYFQSSFFWICMIPTQLTSIAKII